MRFDMAQHAASTLRQLKCVEALRARVALIRGTGERTQRQLDTVELTINDVHNLDPPTTEREIDSKHLDRRLECVRLQIIQLRERLR